MVFRIFRRQAGGLPARPSSPPLPRCTLSRGHDEGTGLARLFLPFPGVLRSLRTRPRYQSIRTVRGHDEGAGLTRLGAALHDVHLLHGAELSEDLRKHGGRVSVTIKSLNTLTSILKYTLV